MGNVVKKGEGETAKPEDKVEPEDLTAAPESIDAAKDAAR